MFPRLPRLYSSSQQRRFRIRDRAVCWCAVESRPGIRAHLQQGSGGVSARVVGSHLVDLVQQQRRVTHAGAPQRLSTEAIGGSAQFRTLIRACVSED